MDKIASFTVNHLKLKPGLYVSRIDMTGGEYVTTFDMRMRTPNVDSIMDTGSVHTIEHLGATFLRNGKDKDKVIYFGPMGCRTGFYIIYAGRLSPEDIFDTVVDMCEYIIAFEGDIPGATPVECGNYSDMNLQGAKEFIKEYLDSLKRDKFFVYES